ncbi:MAG: hypothetical protein RO257_06910 [Candidatus Kapabacteria bacterium]|jgi:hypothetical protein|nr:hypothetical protein [Candidatus Kapabacteria bacterium]
MKELNLILIIVIFLFSTSCIDEEGKKMMEFVNKIVENPDKMEEIIKSSEFYDDEFTEMIKPDYKLIVVNSIKSYKNNSIQYHYEPDAIVNQLDRSQLKGKSIFISSGNILYSPNLQFFFQNINKKWILIDILWGY